MIRAKGHREDGTNTVILVLEPDNLKRIKEGLPVQIDLKALLPDACVAALGTRRLELVLDIAFNQQEFARYMRTMVNRAKETDAAVHIIPAGPKEHM